MRTGSPKVRCSNPTCPHQLVGVDRLGRERLLAREGEQTLRQRGGAFAPSCAPVRY